MCAGDSIHPGKRCPQESAERNVAVSDFGDVAIEFGIGRAVYGPHTALAEFGGNAVVGYRGGWAHGLVFGIVTLLVALGCRVMGTGWFGWERITRHLEVIH